MGASVGGVVPTLTDDNPQTPPCGSGAVPSPCSGGRRGRGEHDSKQQSREVLTAGVAGLAWLSRPWVAGGHDKPMGSAHVLGWHLAGHFRHVI